MAENVAALRKVRNLSQNELSERLGELGRPMLPSAISKIEGRDRSVDVDDLVALAVALRVSPSRLLLPDRGGDAEVALTPSRSAPAFLAWEWANAFAPLPTRSEADGYNTDAELEDFEIHSRPGDVRREQRHPLMLAANNLSYSVPRVLHHASRTPDPARSKPDLGLPTTLAAAGRNLERVAGELDAIEEQSDGER